MKRLPSGGSLESVVVELRGVKFDVSGWVMPFSRSTSHAPAEGGQFSDWVIGLGGHTPFIDLCDFLSEGTVREIINAANEKLALDNGWF